jgi:hypothetical protein
MSRDEDLTNLIIQMVPRIVRHVTPRYLLTLIIIILINNRLIN